MTRVKFKDVTGNATLVLQDVADLDIPGGRGVRVTVHTGVQQSFVVSAGVCEEIARMFKVLGK